MAKFKEFESLPSKGPVWLNLDHVIAVGPVSQNEDQTLVFLSRKLFGEKDLIVRGKPVEVMSKLEAG